MSSENTIPPSRGTSQDQRTPAALDPISAPLDHRSQSQLCGDARDFAENLTFWTPQNQVDARISWADFLPDFENENPEADAAQHAQKALFLAYLRLFQHAQNDLNSLTARHLNFYYRDVLRLAPLPARPDHAHLTATLKKSATEARVPLGTLFTTADKLNYQSTEEVFLRQSQIAHIRSIYQDPATQIVHAAAVSNSADGLGGELSADDPSWHPFGHNRPLPTAECGFALSSPILVMREGTRKITVILKLDFASTPPSDALMSQYFGTQLIAELSGEKVWIPAGSPIVTFTKIGTHTVTVTLVYTVPNTAPAISPYNLTVLTGAFDTVSPVMKWTCADEANSAVAEALSSARLSEVSLKISVSDMKDVDLENDHGKIDASKPFYPFGPIPQVSASFYIGAEEALQKHVTAAKLTIDWKNPPANFATHYAAYPNGAAMTNASFTAQFQILKDGQFQDLSPQAKPLFHATDAASQTTIDSTSAALSFHKLAAVQYQQAFSRKVTQARAELPFSRVAIRTPLATLSVAPIHAFRANLLLPVLQGRSKLSAKSHQGFLRLRLNKSFGQDLYAAAFAAAVSHNSQPENVDQPNKQKPVPNAPYLPEIDSFRLSYDAETQAVNPALTDAASFAAREIRLFHLHPFGQREEHGHIKSTLQTSDNRITLLPIRDSEGQLLLGLTDLSSDQSISLLFQVKDGTADPNSTRREIEWSVLASNHWLPFKDQEILLDTTNGFLSSGIVRFLIPRGVTTHHTLLEPGLTWLRARVVTETKATCRLLSIHPNAIPVTLTDAALAAHLESGLPAKSITAAVSPIQGVKEIAQPYPSTAGAALEQDPAFRTRISERLRHRGRASSAWDYERLVLQNFPKIYQAHALNHTNRDLQSQPGHVALVVLPDSRSSESATSLTPQVDIATLAEINDWLARISSPFATVSAVNPAFEPIHLSFRVAFRSGLPFSSYREILRQDIQAHLAPWVFSGKARADFGGHLYRSALIAMVDALPYVDYLTDFELFHLAFGAAQPRSVQTATASRPGAILSPTAVHQILPIA